MAGFQRRARSSHFFLSREPLSRAIQDTRVKKTGIPRISRYLSEGSSSRAFVSSPRIHELHEKHSQEIPSPRVRVSRDPVESRILKIRDLEKSREAQNFIGIHESRDLANFQILESQNVSLEDILEL